MSMNYPSGYQSALDYEWQEYARCIAEAFDRSPPHKASPRGQGFSAGFAAGYRTGIQRTNNPLSGRQIPALFRASDPQTSVEAAEVASRQAGKLTDLVLNHLRTADLSAGELAQKIGVPRDSISPRIAPLVRRGVIVPVAKRDRQTVYQLAEHFKDIA